jgi:tRNA (cytidine/uridine-2'-O-)-methyltransferase
MPDLALYQPDIAQNTGTLLRLGACLGVPVHVIEPAGFDLSDRALKRAGMDYLEHAALRRHLDWARFVDVVVSERRRIVLATTHAATPYTDFAFGAGDVILLGRESAGVPEAVHGRADARVLIPMRPRMRSINVALSGAMLIGEALRQTGRFPPPGR